MKFIKRKLMELNDALFSIFFIDWMIYNESPWENLKWSIKNTINGIKIKRRKRKNEHR